MLWEYIHLKFNSLPQSEFIQLEVHMVEFSKKIARKCKLANLCDTSKANRHNHREKESGETISLVWKHFCFKSKKNKKNSLSYVKSAWPFFKTDFFFLGAQNRKKFFFSSFSNLFFSPLLKSCKKPNKI